jgi:hypothetical protein
MLDELLSQSELDDSLHMDDLIVGATLGVGTFGRVVLVTHKDTRACFALKILKKRTVSVTNTLCCIDGVMSLRTLRVNRSQLFLLRSCVVLPVPGVSIHRCDIYLRFHTARTWQ